MKFFGKGPILSGASSYHQMILAMKLTAILLTAAFLNVHAGAYSQNVTLNFHRAPLTKVFSEIKKQTGYSFFYNYESLKNAKSVSMEVKNIPLQDVLSLCFSDQPLDYYIQNKTVFVTDRLLTPPAIGTLAVDTAAPDRRIIEGKIVNEKGVPLDNVTVIVKGTNRAVITTVAGEFRIKEAPGAVLVVSRVGYAAQQVKLGNVSTIAITLQSRNEAMSNVEVTYNTGYQTIPKERSTGSFVQISGEELNRQVGPTALQKLYTITPGMVYSPNTANQVVIRGLSTINAISNPLIVVDNFPYEGNGPQGGINALLTEMNPNDIASVTVLKDAAAASIWGIRAANGVIVVTTKSGSFNRRPTISLSSNVTVSGKPNLNYVKTLSSADEIAFEQKLFGQGYYNVYDDSYPSSNYFPILPPVAELLLAVRRGAITQQQADAQIAVYQHHNVKDDIRKYILKDPVAQQHILSFSGGSSNYSYYTSVGYDQATTNQKGGANNRYTIDFKNVYRPVKNLELTGFVNYTQDKVWQNNLQYGSYMPWGSYVAPYTMLADAKGNPLAIPTGSYRLAFQDTAKSPGLLDWHYRPLDEQKFMNNIVNLYHIRMGGIAKYSIYKGLSATVNYQYEKLLSSNYNDQSDSLFSVRNTINNFVLRNPPPGTLPNQVPVGDIYSYNNNNQTIWGIRGTLNYDRTFGDHAVDIIAGVERRQNSSIGNSGTLYGYDPVNGTSKPVNAATNLNTYFGYTQSIGNVNGFSGGMLRYGSYFANGGYTYKGRYTLTASAREDQSNYFGVKAQDRIQPLWSTGAAWELSKEDFYAVSWLPYLKLRATYGFNGNLPNGAFGAGTTAYPTASYGIGTIVSATLPSATISTPNNPQLTFEKVRVINLAVEAASKNRRIGGSLEFYFKNGTNLIGPIPTDATTGWLSYSSNNASIKGHGFDLTINTRNIEGRYFKWHTDFNLSYNTDKVTAYKVPVTATSSYFIDNAVILGKSLYKIFAYRWAGLDSAGSPQIYINGKASSYTNYNNAKPGDLRFMGTDFAHYYGSMMNTFIYKRWSLSANLYYKFGFFFRRPSINYSGLFSGWGGNADYDRRWQKPGDEKITNVPSLPASADYNRDAVYANSDILVTKGDYIRLQDLRLNYDLTKAASPKWPFQSTQVFIYMNNVGILWKANKYGIDPEFYQSTSIPNARTISAGFNVNF